MSKLFILCLFSFQLLWSLTKGLDDRRWFELGDERHLYAKFDAQITWQDAEDRCKSYGAHLLAINSQEEEADIVAKFLSSETAVWIGLTDKQQEGTWVNTDGSTPYFNWNAGTQEPNGGTDQNCAYLTNTANGQGNTNFYMVDSDCQNQIKFICEKIDDREWIELGDEGNRYARFDAQITWQAAEDRCVTYGAHLVSINSQEEEADIVAKFLKNSPSMWIGLNDKEQEGTWVNTDGSTPYFNWNAGTQEPNGGTNQNCAYLTNTANGQGNTNFYMVDGECQNQIKFVCEKKGTPTVKNENVESESSGQVLETTCTSENVNIVLDTNNIGEDHQGIDVEHLYAGLDQDDTTCQPTKANGVLTFNFPLTSCHPTTEHDESKVKYVYSISSANNTLGEAGITRDSNLGMKVTCSFTRTGSASAMYTGAVTVAKFEDEYLGTLSFEMALFTDTGYTDPILNTETVAMNDPVFARIKMKTVAEWQMFVTSCTSSPSEAGSSLTYDLITAGCFQDDTMLENPVSDPLRSYGFKFDAYRFRGASTKEVYITCDVLVCKPNATDASCTKAGKCSSKKRELALLGTLPTSPIDDVKMYEISHKLHIDE